MLLRELAPGWVACECTKALPGFGFEDVNAHELILSRLGSHRAAVIAGRHNLCLRRVDFGEQDGDHRPRYFPASMRLASAINLSKVATASSAATLASLTSLFASTANRLSLIRCCRILRRLESHFDARIGRSLSCDQAGAQVVSQPPTPEA